MVGDDDAGGAGSTARSASSARTTPLTSTGRRVIERSHSRSLQVERGIEHRRRSTRRARTRAGVGAAACRVARRSSRSPSPAGSAKPLRTSRSRRPSSGASTVSTSASQPAASARSTSARGDARDRGRRRAGTRAARRAPPRRPPRPACSTATRGTSARPAPRRRARVATSPSGCARRWKAVGATSDRQRERASPSTVVDEVDAPETSTSTAVAQRDLAEGARGCAASVSSSPAPRAVVVAGQRHRAPRPRAASSSSRLTGAPLIGSGVVPVRAARSRRSSPRRADHAGPRCSPRIGAAADDRPADRAARWSRSPRSGSRPVWASTTRR